MRGPVTDNLSPADQEVIRLCLVAAVNGPYFPDEEFHSLIGLERDDVASVLAAWPMEPDVQADGYASAREVQGVAITNVLVNLLGYPHDHHGEAFHKGLGATEEQVKEALSRLREVTRQ